jgi:hypothetical protein
MFFLVIGHKANTLGKVRLGFRPTRLHRQVFNTPIAIAPRIVYLL